MINKPTLSTVSAARAVVRRRHRHLIQARDWDIEKDFRPELFRVLVLTRPDFIEDVHRAYFDAGADCVRPTPGANKVVLAEFA
jgi:5-methyltetrahydrofolate--homocysteine methyltransferase